MPSSSFDEFAAEKKAGWSDETRAVYEAFSDIFTPEDFARWRTEAMAKAARDELRERMRDWWR